MVCYIGKFLFNRVSNDNSNILYSPFINYKIINDIDYYLKNLYLFVYFSKFFNYLKVFERLTQVIKDWEGEWEIPSLNPCNNRK